MHLKQMLRAIAKRIALGKTSDKRQIELSVRAVEKVESKKMAEQLLVAEPRSAPLANHELNRLADLLLSASGETTFNVEFIDGFCAALIAGPVTGPPERYFEQLLSQRSISAHCGEATEASVLLVRHWHSVEDLLQQGGMVGPLLCQDASDDELGARWACGFLQGMELHFREWAPLLYDEQQNAALFPIVKLAGTRVDPRQGLRPAIAFNAAFDAPRSALLTDMALAVLHIYRFFSDARRLAVDSSANTLH